MRQEKICSIRYSLVQRLEALWSIADDTVARMKNTGDKFADPFDQAALECNKFVELACRDRERQLILDIKEAIIRIDRGLYGICNHCGRIIDAKRLAVEPLVRLCTACQEKREGGRKQKYRRMSVSCNHA